jgi:hypothetical protein
MEASPVRFVSWPFWERTQLPPDCFKQPRSTVSWLPEAELVAFMLLFWLFWSVVEGVVGALVEGEVWVLGEAL